MYRVTTTYKRRNEEYENKDIAFYDNEKDAICGQKIAEAILTGAKCEIVESKIEEGYFFTKKSFDKLRKNI